MAFLFFVTVLIRNGSAGLIVSAQSPSGSPQPSPSGETTPSPTVSLNPTPTPTITPTPTPTVTSTATPPAGTLTVSATPKGGWYKGSVVVKLEASDPNATIYYSVDSTHPRNGHMYTGPIAFNQDTVLSFFATKDPLETTVIRENYIVVVGTAATPTPAPKPSGAESFDPMVSALPTAQSSTPLFRGENQPQRPRVPLPPSGAGYAAAIASVGLLAAPAVTGAFALAQLIQLGLVSLQNAWSSLFVLAGWRKRRMPWGRVLDSVTNQPIPGAIVAIHNRDRYGKVIDRAITDNQGRFGFLVAPGHYSLSVKKAGFTFPSHINSDGYHGDTFPVGKEGMVVVDLFCDPAEAAAPLMLILKRMQRGLNYIRLPLLVLGTILSLYALFQQVTVVNVLIALIYLALWLWELLHARTGRHTIAIIDNKKPVPFAIVRLINKKTGAMALAKATDSEGEVYVLVPGGTYKAQVTSPKTARVSEHSLDLPKGTPFKPVRIEL